MGGPPPPTPANLETHPKSEASNEVCLVARAALMKDDPGLCCEGLEELQSLHTFRGVLNTVVDLVGKATTTNAFTRQASQELVP